MLDMWGCERKIDEDEGDDVEYGGYVEIVEKYAIDGVQQVEKVLCIGTVGKVGCGLLVCT